MLYLSRVDTLARLGRKGGGVKTDHMEPSPAGQQPLDTDTSHYHYLVTTPQICFSPAAAGSVTVLPMLQLLHILDHKILVCRSAVVWW